MICTATCFFFAGKVRVNRSSPPACFKIPLILRRKPTTSFTLQNVSSCGYCITFAALTLGDPQHSVL